MNATASNISIAVLVSGLIGTSYFAYGAYFESPKERADRINLSDLRDCLERAKKEPVLDEAIKAASACPKSKMIQVIVPNST